MRETVVPEKVDEFSVLIDPEEQSPSLSPMTYANLLEQESVSIQVPRSYQPYPWNFLNHLLDIIDVKTNGRAGWLQRFVSYLFFGGTAALVNLTIFYVMFYHVLASVNLDIERNALSYITAAELSILANFIPNDRFTFSKLPGAKRPWIQRCLRFHMTTIIGSLLTFLIELALSTFTHIPAILAEAVATLIVLVYNFSFHHLFTYRHVKHA